VHLRRQAGNLAADGQVDIDIETVGLERGAVALFHLAYFRSDIANSLVRRFAIQEMFPCRMTFMEMQVVTDQGQGRLVSEGLPALMMQITRSSGFS
jgi:hypothetical protein